MGDLIRERYEPIEVAGRGGQGEVLRARDHMHDREVALKVRVLADPSERDSILSEVRVLLGLKPHPHLPLVREDFFEDDRYMLVVDWIAGDSLEKVLQRDGDPGLPVSRALRYLEQVAGALDHLHAHTPPIIHQDVKPANLIVDADGKVVLVDFGIAGTSDTAATAGTKGYMAPEIAGGMGPTAASDIYSLAATAFALLTGAPPEGERPDWEGVSPQQTGVIERALRRAFSTDPARRPATARELVEQLRAFMDTALPSGTVTFLLTDIEGATKLWEQDAGEMSAAVQRYEALVADTVERAGGRMLEMRTDGGTSLSVFPDASDALAAAVDLQRACVRAQGSLKVRVALHTGEAEMRAGRYYGPAVGRAARLRASAHGDQVVLSEAAADLARDALPAGAALRDLGLHRLKDLARAERIFQLLHPDLPEIFPDLASLDTIPNNLPVQVTHFIGREREIASGKELLGTTRLLTVTGLGGAGKTRLALQLAADVLEEFPDGVWLVELAPITDPELVTQAVASALGVREEAERALLESLVGACRTRKTLIVLDTCEHLIAACAQLVESVLRGGRDTGFLVTSSEPLSIGGETVLPIPSLSLPASDAAPVEEVVGSEAVELFVERARQAKPSFTFGEQNAMTVAQICRRLDGIPLALELAAARVKVLTVEQISARLDDRFRLLTGGSRTALPHQQTLRAAMDWSYEPLAEEDRTLFRHLAVFAGGCTLEAAQHVCLEGALDEYEVLSRLSVLVDKSLLLVDETGGEARYRMLQTVHQYARERLEESGETARVRELHFEWFRSFVGRVSGGRRGAMHGEELAPLAAETDNIRAALAWVLEQRETPHALEFILNLESLWVSLGNFTEGRAWLVRASSEGADAKMRADRDRLAGVLAWYQGDFAEASVHYERSLSLYLEIGDASKAAGMLNNLGAVAHLQGDHVRARGFFERSLETHRTSGDRYGLVQVLSNLGSVADSLGDHEGARARFEETLVIARDLGDDRIVAALLNNIGSTSENLSEFPRARELYEEALTIRRRLGVQHDIANSLGNLGSVARRLGEFERARALMEESLAITRALGDKRSEAVALQGLGTVLIDCERFPEARDRLEEGLRIGREIGAREVIAGVLTTLDTLERAQPDS